MIGRVIKLALVAAAVVAGLFKGIVTFRSSPENRATQAAPQSSEASAINLKRWSLRLGALLFVLAFGGFLLAASGIIPLKASSGHWAVTEWFLQFSSQRSISTHSLGIEVPPLDEPWLVVKGASHFETGCSPCHGSPTRQTPRIAQAMMPLPPYLPATVARWETEELFYIVKHGIKFTGMPAWPTQTRDDEVWAMAAFLRRLPELSAEQYRQLATGVNTVPSVAEPLRGLQGTELTPRPVTESCGRCHGQNGQGRDGAAFPKLAGQPEAYLYAAMQAYARGERPSGIMGPLVGGLSSAEMRDLAVYYSRQAATVPTGASDAASIERGAAIARQGIPGQRVPACIECHGPSPVPKNPHYPILAGQYADYLVLQLELFKRGQRGGSAYAHIMHQVGRQLTSEQIREVASYYASLGAGLGTSSP